MPSLSFHRVALAAAVLAFAVVVLGAYVRLAGAGLGCPDWPGCYGHLGVPEEGVPSLGEFDRPLQPAKAWKEMVHRYLAGVLGIVVFGLAGWAWWRRGTPGQALRIPLFLAVLVVGQALLGMWTVTQLLKPLVVTGHLLGGMAVLALLFWLGLSQSRWGRASVASSPLWRRWTGLALVALAAQIALGGWTSANYAALACPDFPTCQGQWWPPMDFGEAFVLWRETGIDYEGGILSSAARTAIHWSHRIGALVTLLVAAPLAVALLRKGPRPQVRKVAGIVGFLLVIQLGLGAANSLLGLPLFLAVAHNAFAALLLLSLVTLYHTLWSRRRPLEVDSDLRAPV